jgi:hypothetical protein
VRHPHVLVLGLAAVAALAVAGCASSAREIPVSIAPSASVQASAVPAASAGIRVPDVVTAVSRHEFSASYDKDPGAAADELRTFVVGYLHERGLAAEVQLQSVARPDTQTPAPGSAVASGTVVEVHIGFGD